MATLHAGHKPGTLAAAGDKTSLDITWLKDKSLADLDNLPDPDVLALDIMENLEAGLENFRSIVRQLG
ncbi:hypothetical protein [Mucilaginibacter psychrotolerans]|uniref:hypothetical protein n=1 Tax=Mucilaginibacter psychrotolerans TaxID=1524096 RepID=UPI00195DE0FC|nr:hypothetical protein [Mucilaginibacter psychrotolerans]